MVDTYNVYCDESCYMENDPYKVFVLGAIWAPKNSIYEISSEIRLIKEKYDLPRYTEIKWVKVSPSKVDFYLELINYFFTNPKLNFRCLVVPDKKILNHAMFNQTHDEWYYKMYFDMLKIIFSEELNPDSEFFIYLDMKDTAGGKKVRKLHEVLCNNQHDFQMKVIKKIQVVDSKEVELQQLTDLLIGAVSYVNRNLSTSEAKKAVSTSVIRYSRISLQHTTSNLQRKFNILIWHPKAGV